MIYKKGAGANGKRFRGLMCILWKNIPNRPVFCKYSTYFYFTLIIVPTNISNADFSSSFILHPLKTEGFFFIHYADVVLFLISGSSTLFVDPFHGPICWYQT